MTDRAYERISLDNERSGSISKQKTRIEGFAGTDLTHYTDESVSGSKVKFADREAGARLLEDLRPGDRVLVTKIDRAARNVRDLLDLVDHIDKAGASIVFVDQNIDTSGPIGKFILVLLAAIAELEANIIGERRKESLAVFAKEGRHASGAAPFGLRSVANPSGRGLVIRPDTEPRDELGGRSPAEAVQEAVRRVLAGESQASVAATLPLKEAGFSVLLRNPRLAGMTPDPAGGVVMIDGTPRIDPEAALLSLSDWSRLRDHMKRPDKRSWSRQDGYGASLRCSVCDGRLYKSVSKQNPQYDSYKCGRARHEKGSPSASIATRLADPQIEELFLTAHGDRQVVVTGWSEDEDLRTEAISVATIALDAVRRKQDMADSDEEEESLMVEYLAAKRALRDAYAMTGERVYQAAYAGETVRERWERSDDTERCRMLNAAGKWYVAPGRKRSDKKVTLVVDELLTELRTHPVGDGDDAPVGFLL